METLLAIWLLATADKAYLELTHEPPVVKVEKLPVDPKLYYPDLVEDMWDPNWINKKT